MGQSPVKEQGVAGMHFDLFLSDLIFHCAGKQIQQFPALPCNGASMLEMTAQVSASKPNFARV